MSKKPYSAAEIAFLIGYADYCVNHGSDYAATVASEFNKKFPRKVIWDNLRSKLIRLLRDYGLTKPSVTELGRLGTGYIGMAVIPSDVRTEMERFSNEWGFPSLGAEITVPGGPSVPVTDVDDGASPNDETESSSPEEQITLQSDTDRRNTRHHIEDTPQQQHSESSATDDRDGAADRMTSPSFSSASTPAISSNRAAGRKRSATPIDMDDLEYQPTPKRKKVGRDSSDRRPASVISKDVAVQRTHGPTKTLNTAKPDNQSANKKTNIMTPILQSSSSASNKARAASVINIDDRPEESRAITSPSRIAGEKKATEASKDNAVPPEGHFVQPSSPSASKRKVVELSDDEATKVISSPKRQKTDLVSLESLDQKVDACFEMISNMIMYQQSPPEEYSEHIYQLIRTFKDPKGSIVGNLIKDLDSQRSLKTKYSTIIRRLVGFVDSNDGTVFPKTPAQNEVDQMWTTFYKHIVSTIGPNNINPSPTPEGAGYLTCAAEEIANGRISDDQLEACIDSLNGYLISPHSQQTLFSALFCRWIFASPEPMLNSMHSDGMMQLYNGVVDTAHDPNAEGLAKVQQYDEVATKLMFEDPDFQRVQVSRRTSEFKSRFETAKEKLCRPSKIPSSLSPSKFAKEAIAFKQKLLLSRKEYRIHFVRPGYKFQASRMQAYDHTNEPVSDAKAAGKQVLLCMFPMLTCKEPHATKENAKIEDALCKNKNFFPTFKESMQVPSPGLQISKAVVLVSQD